MRRKETVRAAVAKEFQAQISEIRSKWQNALRALRAEQERRHIAVQEHQALAGEIERYREQDRAERQQLELRRSGEIAAARAAHIDSIRHLEGSKWLELEQLPARHTVAVGALQSTVDRVSAEAKRLRTERDSARREATRFSSERNTLRQELLELRARQSRVTVATQGAALFINE